MILRKFFVTALIIFLLSGLGIAQTAPGAADPEKAKKKKESDELVLLVLDQIIAEANALRLPQNRAVVYALSGDMYWKFDAKRSRELFRAAAAEIGTFNLETEKEKNERTEPLTFVTFAIFETSDPRYDILSLIGQRDPDLALELLIPTRSASLAEAMAKASVSDVKAANIDTGTDGGSGIGSGSGDSGQVSSAVNSKVRREIALEMRFRTSAARSDPEKAIKAIKDSLAKGISPNVISLLQVVFQKDEKKAAELSGEVVRKIVDADLAKNNADLTGTMSILQSISSRTANANPKSKSFRFSETQVKDIANKLANTFLQPGTSSLVSAALARSLSILEKILPEKIAALKQRDTQNWKTKSGRSGTQQFYDPNITPEEILAQAVKLTKESEKTSAYRAAALRIAQIKDEAQAKKLIDQIPDEKLRASLTARFEAERIRRLTAADKYDEARRAIDLLTDKKLKIQKLVALAVQSKRKGDKVNVENANGFMYSARALVNPFPENEDEIADLMEVVKGYAAVEPDAAFPLIEPVIDQFNEIVQATAVLSKYNKRDRAFRKGELVMSVRGNAGGMLVFKYIQQIQSLGRADLDRASRLADRFQRSDFRMVTKLYVLQGYFKTTQFETVYPIDEISYGNE